MEPILNNYATMQTEDIDLDLLLLVDGSNDVDNWGNLALQGKVEILIFNYSAINKSLIFISFFNYFKLKTKSRVWKTTMIYPAKKFVLKSKNGSQTKLLFSITRKSFCKNFLANGKLSMIQKLA